MAKKILIVDDDPDVVLFLSTVLQDNGYATVEASDGRDGLQKARDELPQLILLDLMMPHKSGIALLSELKEDDRLKAIPVIMVTGVTGETGIDFESFLAARPREASPDGPPRPDGYLEKPVAPERLLALVERIVGQP